MIITIDGTMGSGKGTLAKRLATLYQLPHMDTGLLYRAVGYQAICSGVSLSDEVSVAMIASSIDIANYQNGDHDLRSQEVSNAASVVSALPKVRAALLGVQRSFSAPGKSVVMDGRDIGTVICPHANFKFWLDASPSQRAFRRWTELSGRGDPVPYDDVYAQLRERDLRDMSRANAPMKISADAIQIDTTTLAADDVFLKAVEIIEASRAAAMVSD